MLDARDVDVGDHGIQSGRLGSGIAVENDRGRVGAKFEFLNVLKFLLLNSKFMNSKWIFYLKNHLGYAKLSYFKNSK